MPIFDYQCSKCGHVKMDYFVRYYDNCIPVVLCDCGYVMNKMPSVPNMHLFPISGIHLKHVCHGGKTFHSKNEMKKYAKENNLELGALL